MAPKKKGGKPKKEKAEKGEKPEKKGARVLRYHDEEYWNNRYTNDLEVFDWYQTYRTLQKLISKHIPKEARNLIIGCGNSTMSEEMVKDGYTEIMNVDSSATCIEQMNAKYKGIKEFSAMVYMRQDMKELKMFKDLTVDNVIDKGLLDSVLCGANAPENVKLVLSEIRRVLALIQFIWGLAADLIRVMKPQCKYMVITYGDPRTRMPYLKDKEFPWAEILVYVIPRPYSVKESQEKSRPIYEPVYVVEDYTLGPQFNLDDPDWHYVYVLTKEEPPAKEAPVKKKK